MLSIYIIFLFTIDVIIIFYHQFLIFVSASNELVFINFYADWCFYSKKLQPIFDEAADKIKEAHPEVGKVVMGKVDCDQERE